MARRCDFSLFDADEIWDLARYTDGEIPSDLHYEPTDLARIDTTYMGEAGDPLAEFRWDLSPAGDYGFGIPMPMTRGMERAEWVNTDVEWYQDATVLENGWQIRDVARSYEPGDLVCDPRHYLALIERKPGALDQAAPLQGWALPPVFAEMRRLLEARSGRAGKREYIQILRLTEIAAPAVVGAAVTDAIRRGVIGFDAVKQLLLARLEGRPPRLDPRAYPYLPTATVKTTSTARASSPP